MKKQTETLMLLTAIMMAACSADENVSTQTEAGDAVNFTVGMASGITRAFTYDNKWTLNDKIAIYDGSVVCQYEPQESSENSGDRVSLKPSTTTTATAFFWSPLVTSRTFSGWYPYAASKPSEISGATDQRSNTFYYDGNQGSLTNDQYNALDVLYAPDVTMERRVS